jgi:hypothetical protein
VPEVSVCCPPRFFYFPKIFAHFPDCNHGHPQPTGTFPSVSSRLSVMSVINCSSCFKLFLTWWFSSKQIKFSLLFRDISYILVAFMLVFLIKKLWFFRFFFDIYMDKQKLM